MAGSPTLGDDAGAGRCPDAVETEAGYAQLVTQGGRSMVDLRADDGGAVLAHPKLQVRGRSKWNSSTLPTVAMRSC